MDVPKYDGFGRSHEAVCEMNHILIVSLSRSGGKLLRTLLDGHPQLNVFPFEHWNRKSKNEIPTRRIEAFDGLSVEEKLATAGAAHVERKLMRLHPPELLADVMQTWRVETASRVLNGPASGRVGSRRTLSTRPRGERMRISGGCRRRTSSN